MSDIPQRLYDSEINFHISCFWDGGFHVSLGDDMNGFDAETQVHTFAEALVWLDQEARKQYPDSLYVTGKYPAGWAASGKPENERPDWPLPSFDAQDWAAAFCKVANGFGFKDNEGKPIDEGWMISWFANALMRGFDEATARKS